jgi:basic membrane protein A and related proteins
MRRARPSTFRASAALLAALAAGAVAGCGSDDEAAGGGEGGGGAKKTAIYVSSNPLGTNQFLNLIADGAKAGGAECGVNVKVVQSSDPSTLAANLRAAVQSKPDLIVANSFDSVETIGGLVKQSPDQKWALVDASVENAPNVRGILFKENEGMFLIGAAYAMLAKGDQGDEWPASKSVGFVGAIDNALVRRWYNGYAQGVKEENPGARVLVGWGNSFNDPATSKELALSQYSKGARYIAGVAAAGNSGVFEAAADRDFFTSGVDVDERPKDPEHIILSMVKRSDQAVRKAVCDAAKGSFKGGVETLGIKENAVGPEFLTLPEEELKTPSKLPEEVQDRLKELKEQVGSGKITVKQ